MRFSSARYAMQSRSPASIATALCPCLSRCASCPLSLCVLSSHSSSLPCRDHRYAAHAPQLHSHTATALLLQSSPHRFRVVIIATLRTLLSCTATQRQHCCCDRLLRRTQSSQTRLHRLAHIARTRGATHTRRHSPPVLHRHATSMRRLQRQPDRRILHRRPTSLLHVLLRPPRRLLFPALPEGGRGRPQVPHQRRHRPTRVGRVGRRRQRRQQR